MPQSVEMLRTWGVPEEILARLGRHAGRQRTMFHEGHLLLVLHKVPKFDSDIREAVYIFRTADAEWKSNIEHSQDPLDDHLQSYVDILAKLNRNFQKAQTARGYFYLFNRILPIARACNNLHEALQDARTHLRNDQRMIDFRDEAYDIKRTAELLCEEAQHALDYKTAQRAEEQARQAESQARAAHRLNLIAALFLPITAVASIFGTNLKTGLEWIDSPVFFWFLMIVSLVTGFLMRGAIAESFFKKR